MAKYHIGKDNKIRICRATKTNCPLQHFSTKEEAEKYIEKVLENNNEVLSFEDTEYQKIKDEVVNELTVGSKSSLKVNMWNENDYRRFNHKGNIFIYRKKIDGTLEVYDKYSDVYKNTVVRDTEDLYSKLKGGETEIIETTKYTNENKLVELLRADGYDVSDELLYNNGFIAGVSGTKGYDISIDHYLDENLVKTRAFKEILEDEYMNAIEGDEDSVYYDYDRLQDNIERGGTEYLMELENKVDDFIYEYDGDAEATFKRHLNFVPISKKVGKDTVVDKILIFEK